MHKAKILMPALVLALVFGFSTVAQAQLSCQVSSVPVSRVADTTHTGEVGDLNFNCIAGANAVNTGVLTVDFGLTITNDEAGNQGGADITLSNLTGEFAGLGAGDIIVSNTSGTITVALPPSGAPPANSTMTLGGVLTSTYNAGLSNVIANISTSAGSNYFIQAGQNNATVINAVLPGIDDPSIVGGGGGEGRATLFSNGVIPDDTFEFRVRENFIDFFKNGGADGAQPNQGLETNDTEVELTFENLFEDLELDCAISGDGGPVLTPTTITEDDNVAVVTFTTDFVLTSTEDFNVECVTDLANNPDLPLPLVDITVQATLAPTGNALGPSPFFAVLDGATTGQIPRFEEVPQPDDPLVVATIEQAVTNLLIPFASYNAPFDTGIAVANTSWDPFGNDGAEPVDGTLSFTFSPNDGSGDFSYDTGPGSPGVGLNSAGEVEAGGTYSVLLSELLEAADWTDPFSGYVFIESRFTNGHGQAFITDFSGFTSAADVLVVPLDRVTDNENLNK